MADTKITREQIDKVARWLEFCGHPDDASQIRQAIKARDEDIADLKYDIEKCMNRDAEHLERIKELETRLADVRKIALDWSNNKVLLRTDAAYLSEIARHD